MSSSARVDAASLELAECLYSALGSATGDLVMEAIQEFVDAKVDAAVTDLTHRINKTGEYSPDY